jgi:hypothetical protein
MALAAARHEAAMSLNTATKLWRMSATELAAAVRSGQVSSREVIEAHFGGSRRSTTRLTRL